MKNYKFVNPSEIIISPDRTLYIIGNGFDLMHGVPSGYKDFEKSIGKNNHLRIILEKCEKCVHSTHFSHYKKAYHDGYKTCSKKNQNQ